MKAFGIAVDALGYAYVTGLLAAQRFPHHAGGLGTQHCQHPWVMPPNADVLVLKLRPDGSDLAYSTLLGKH